MMNDKTLLMHKAFCWLVALTTLCILTSVVYAVDRNAPTIFYVTPASSQSESIMPFGPSIEGYQPKLSSVLPPLSKEALEQLREEDATPSSDVHRIGISRDLRQAIIVNKSNVPAAEWTTTKNGWKILSIEITAEEAHGIRVRVTDVSFPDGVRLIFYVPTTPAKIDKIVTWQSLYGENSVIAGPIFGEKATIECQVPPNVSPSSVSFTISSISYLYR